MVMTRPILLITASPPGGIGVGQLYMRSVLQHAQVRFAVAALLGRHEPTYHPSADFGILVAHTLRRRFEPAFRPWQNPLGNLAAAMAVQARLQPHVRGLRAFLAGLAHEHGIGALLVVLECPTTMLLAAPLADLLGLPLVTLVWDTPEHVLGRLGYAGIAQAPILRGFDQALRRSQSVAVMSEAMRGRFERNHGARCVIVHQPIEPAWCRASSELETDRAEWVIGFAGSVTAWVEMDLLLNALDGIRWQIQGRPIVLRVFGLRFVCEASVPRRIDYRGYLPEIGDVVHGLSTCDVLFLPQPFGSDAVSFTRYSFPTKLTTYLAARCPILLFAPDYSALTIFFKDNELPLVCSQPEESALIKSLRSLVENQELRQTALQRIEAVRETAFSVATCRQRLDELFVPTLATPQMPLLGRRGARVE